MYDEAIAEFHMAEGLSRELWARTELAHAYAASGRRDESEKILDELRGQPERSKFSPYQMAIIYAGLEEKDRAFEWLERTYEQRNHGLVELKVEPMLDSLRSDPRFTDLLQRIGLAS